MASGKPAPDPPMNVTRQVLDELEALMERMLAVPIADTDAPASAPAPESPTAVSPSRPLAATLTLLPVADREPPVFALPLSATPRPREVDPPHHGTNPSHLPWSPTAEITLPPLPPAPANPPAAPEPNLDALLAEIPEPPLSTAGWFILPVIWGNRLFDACTLPLGESGVWLRGPVGRGVIGMTGLLLLAAATLWVARDWLGWTW
jgi:hypothetical protein